MECRQCASPLDRPGDYCLVCRTRNADAVVLDLAPERATLTPLDEDDPLPPTDVTAVREDDPDADRRALRNLAGRVADEVRRRRPEEVYAAGDRPLLCGVRERITADLYRVAADDPVAAALDRRTGRALDVVETAPADKIGGTHSTLIGGRRGQEAIRVAAGHPHVKKVIPGPIDAGGTGSQSGLAAKATRADGNGNVRLLVRNGTSVQENRIVTTARDRESGEWVREDLNEALDGADLRE
ncbi:metal-binding protein [Halobacteriales archaeon SW_7_68_16]|nr:MAG: metal-binding protein [Halobacteriales archaeon SW_7_68_16]